MLAILCAMLCLVTLSCPTLYDPMDWVCSPPGFSVHGASPGRNTGVGCHALLQGTFATQVSHIAGGFFTVWANREAVSHPSGCERVPISLQFWFAFPKWITRVSSFSCAYWPFMCFLSRNVCSTPERLKDWSKCLLLLTCRSSLYIWILDSCQLYNLQTFPSFHFLALFTIIFSNHEHDCLPIYVGLLWYISITLSSFQCTSLASFVKLIIKYFRLFDTIMDAIAVLVSF